MPADTRYLFPLIRFNVLSQPPLAPSQQPPLSGESGCKDTTFFHSAKIFFSGKWTPPALPAVPQRVASRKIFELFCRTAQKHPAKRPRGPSPGTFSAHRGAACRAVSPQRAVSQGIVQNNRHSRSYATCCRTAWCAALCRSRAPHGRGGGAQLRPPLPLSALSPSVVRLLSDCCPIVVRLVNGQQSDNNRTTNGQRTERLRCRYCESSVCIPVRFVGCKLNLPIAK